MYKRVLIENNIYKKVILFATCLLLYFTASAQPEIVTKLIKEGVALHEKGDYEAAIAKFDRALILAPNDFNANYEKSASLLFARQYNESILLSKWLIENYQNKPDLRGVYINLGNAYDDQGIADSALMMYNEGIKKFPEFHLLYFNKALTYARQKNWDTAYALFHQSLERAPSHASSLYYAALLEEKENKVAAIIGSLVFLAIEPEGKRAKSIYEYLFSIFHSYGKNTNAALLTDTSGKRKNNFSLVESKLASPLAELFTDSANLKTDVEKLALVIERMSETVFSSQKKGTGIFWETYVPFFNEMKQQNLVETFAHIASITSGNEENIQWINQNQEKLKTFYQWMQKFKLQK